jgi:hypothetical protein
MAKAYRHAGGPVAKPKRDRFEDKIIRIPEAGCWLWMAYVGKDGYGHFSWATRTSRLAHRAAWEIFCGPIPDGLDILHRCDVRCCVNPHHLFLGTDVDNAKDSVQKGRRAAFVGVDNPSVKLSVEQVLAIRSSTISQKEAAKKYGVCQATISWIRTGKHWTHIL